MTLQEKNDERVEAIKKAIISAIEEAPNIKGLTVKQAAEKLNVPEPTTYSYMERLRAEGVLGYTTVGKTKIYLKKRR